jgi:hypothetical protein
VKLLVGGFVFGSLSWDAKFPPSPVNFFPVNGLL